MGILCLGRFGRRWDSIGLEVICDLVHVPPRSGNGVAHERLIAMKAVGIGRHPVAT